MENNIGGKIKILAKVVLVIMVISTIAGALTAAITTGKATAWACPRTVTKTDYGYYGYYSYEVQEKNGAAGFFAGAGVFLAICGGGIVSAYVCYMFLYAYGQLVEDTQINRQTNQENRQILKKLYDLKLQEKRNNEKETPGITTQKTEPAKTTASGDGKQEPEAVAPGKMRCPNCGAEQPAGRKVCWECGSPMIRKPVETKTVSRIWTCPKCNTINDASARYCLVCGEHSPKSEMPAKTEEHTPAGEAPSPFASRSLGEDTPATKTASAAWTCPKCNTINDAGAHYCLVCGEQRPKTETPTWTCPKCKTVNLMRNRYCQACGERCR